MTGIGEVLETARRAKGMTQAELAEAAGVTQAALSRYEHDLRAPEPEVLEQLAAALGITTAVLGHGGRMEGGIAVGAHMRRRATARPTVWRQLEAQLNMTRLHASRLFEEVSMRADRQVPTFDPIDVEPRDAARLLRAQWRMPVGPVRSLVTWMEAAGILVVEDEFGPSARVDGLSQWAGAHPLVMVNAAAPTDRKRWTLAHELGHLVLHSDLLDENAESQANAFAAEVLMPADEIRSSLRGLTLGRLVDLKRYWGVSIAALIERAHALGMVSAAERTAFYKTLSARGMRTTEPASAELTPEVPRLARHIADSLAERGLGPSEVARLAGFANAEQNRLFVASRAERPLRVV
jgi:Zn-dependent peptidase ImmA (M78 family)/transcriptional regulator with XRE-family HTH domain